jgi:addiction module RelE/StbE family toxin
VRSIHWTDEALEQALEIREYLAVTSPEYAERVVDNLFQRVGQLVEFPYSGTGVSPSRAATIRELLVRPYRLIYEVTDRQIRVMAVFYQYQNP